MPEQMSVLRIHILTVLVLKLQDGDGVWMMRILVLTQLIEDFLTKNIVLKRTIWMKPELQFGMAKRITSLI